MASPPDDVEIVVTFPGLKFTYWGDPDDEASPLDLMALALRMAAPYKTEITVSFPGHGYLYEGDIADPNEPPEGARHYLKSAPLPHPLSAAGWRRKIIVPRRELLGSIYNTTARIMGVAPTGLGKTLFYEEAAYRMSQGRGFLHWSASGRPCRVLYVDGEMSTVDMKARIDGLFARHGEAPTFFCLSADDVGKIPPLNTTAGQAFIERHIALLGGVDFAFFDNIQGLTLGNQRETDIWQGILPWTRELTQRRIGQLWQHHANEDGSPYGDKTRAWQLDTMMSLTGDAGVWPPQFEGNFTKKRGQNARNRADYEPFIATFDETTGWTRSDVRRGKASDRALTYLDQVIQHKGIAVSAGSDPKLPAGKKVGLVSHWKQAWVDGEKALGSKQTDKQLERAFERPKKELLAGNPPPVIEHEVFVWINP